MDDLIPYARQWVDEQDIKSVTEVLKGDWLTTGPKIEEFEKKFADFVDAKYAVTLSSGTAALHASSFAAGIKKGDEVIVSPMTFAASSNCILYQNGKPVFADIDKKTYNINPEKIKEKITDNTKAIIPVDYSGHPCKIKKIMKIAKKHDLTVVEDASHAVGATIDGKKIGGLADMSVFSFHPVKIITTGEGGIVTTDREEFYEKLIKFRNHGITKDHNQFVNKNTDPWFYEQQYLGYNYRLTDLQCALGISQLKKVNMFLEKRREIAKKYTDNFKDLKGVIPPYQKRNVESSWHLYVIQLELEKLKVDRKKIFNDFLEKKLGVQVHYIPVYYHPYYQKSGYKKGICPNAEWLYKRIITIPLYPKMTEEDVGRVIEIVNEIIDKYIKD